MRAAAAKAGLNVQVDSVGTAAYHIGETPDPRAIATARRHGVDISDLRGRQLSEADLERFTHVFAMDKGNMAGITARLTRHSSAEVALLLDLVDGRAGHPVDDPFYGNAEDFEACWQTISTAVEALVARLSAAQ